MSRFDLAARQSLLQRARAAIACAIGAASFIPQHESPIPDDLCAGAFVTLRLKGELRGCIGYPHAELPLLEAIERCAVSAAISDPRFPPVSPVEWGDVDLEISVLGPIEPVHDISEIVVGRHGLVVEFGRYRGLLLPQVAVEWNWNAEQFACETCHKAGLPKDAWRTGATLFKFEAEVFGEKQLQEI
jgi:AmmeMemoRadiSam system protein A